MKSKREKKKSSAVKRTTNITRGGLVCRVTSAEETRRLRAADEAEYRKRRERNKYARAIRYGFSF